MEIKKFEALSYKQKTLTTINRKDFISLLRDYLTDFKVLGYECSGTSYDDEVLLLHVDKFSTNQSGINKHLDSKVIRLDFSEMGIEIGSMNSEDDDIFIPQVSLDDQTNIELRKELKDKAKDLKKNTQKFNI